MIALHLAHLPSPLVCSFIRFRHPRNRVLGVFPSLRVLLALAGLGGSVAFEGVGRVRFELLGLVAGFLFGSFVGDLAGAGAFLLLFAGLGFGLGGLTTLVGGGHGDCTDLSL